METSFNVNVKLQLIRRIGTEVDVEIIYPVGNQQQPLHILPYSLFLRLASLILSHDHDNILPYIHNLAASTQILSGYGDRIFSRWITAEALSDGFNAVVPLLVCVYDGNNSLLFI